MRPAKLGGTVPVSHVDQLPAEVDERFVVQRERLRLDAGRALVTESVPTGM